MRLRSVPQTRARLFSLVQTQELGGLKCWRLAFVLHGRECPWQPGCPRPWSAHALPGLSGQPGAPDHSGAHIQQQRPEKASPPPLRLKVAAREAPGSLRPPPHVSRGPLGPHPPSRPAPEAPGGDSASGSGMGGLSLQAEASTLFTKGTYGAKNNDRLALFSPGHSGRVGPATGHRTDRPLPTLHPCSRAGKRQGPRRPRTGKRPRRRVVTSSLEPLTRSRGTE